MAAMAQKITSLFSQSLPNSTSSFRCLRADFTDWPADYPQLFDALDMVQRPQHTEGLQYLHSHQCGVHRLCTIWQTPFPPDFPPDYFEDE